MINCKLNKYYKSNSLSPFGVRGSYFFIHMKKNFLILAILLFTVSAFAQKDTTAVDSFKFTILKQNKITSVKNQASSGTCWSFSGLGFLESELLRMGKPEVDLSQMFVVHHS